jgi:hypothetical protein
VEYQHTPKELWVPMPKANKDAYRFLFEYAKDVMS